MHEPFTKSKGMDMASLGKEAWLHAAWAPNGRGKVMIVAPVKHCQLVDGAKSQHPWNAEESIALAALITKGCNAQQIASALGRTYKSVTSRAVYIGLETPQGWHTKHNPESEAA